ncbi:MAG: PIN domain-containing protein [Solirubrobacteraceae bacterium]
MRVVLDASALVAIVAREPSEPEAVGLLRSGGAAMVAVNLAEAIDVLLRAGHAAERVRAQLQPAIQESLAVIPLDEPLAWRAAELRAVHYHRTRSAISIADCALIAALGEGDEAASSDAALLRIARAEGFDIRPLPDSRGRRPRI